MILLEISADRDAPVPAKYRRAVDRYFRTLAGDAETVDATASATAGGAATGSEPAGSGPAGGSQ
jgi:hypothetical protein